MATPGIAIVLPTFWACYLDRMVVSCPSAGPLEDSVRVVPKNEHRLVSQSQYALKTRERSGANETKKRRAIGSRSIEARRVAVKKKEKKRKREKEREKKQKGKTISSEHVDSRSTVTRFHREWKPHIKPISGISRVKKKKWIFAFLKIVKKLY